MQTAPIMGPFCLGGYADGSEQLTILVHICSIETLLPPDQFCSPSNREPPSPETLSASN